MTKLSIKGCPLSDQQLRKLALVKAEDLQKHIPGVKRNILRMWHRQARELVAREQLQSLSGIDIQVNKREQQSTVKLLEQKNEILTDEVIRLRAELEGSMQLKHTPQTHVIAPPSQGTGSEATIFFIASDWHYEEKVDPETVSGLNEYSLAVADQRIDKFFQNALRLYRIFERDIKIPNIVLALLGDFISGSIHEELMEGNQLLPADAIWQVQNRIISGIDFLLSHTKAKLIVPCHSGNHGRMTHKQRHATEAGNSLESLMYQSIALYYRKEPRIQFMIAEGYHTYLDTYGKIVRLHHGHDMRFGGGVGGIYIPVNKAIAQWNKAKPAALDVFGHFHQFRDGGNFICNGSLIGYNAFALSIKADYEEPRQACFLMDRKRGKTFVAPILT